MPSERACSKRSTGSFAIASPPPYWGGDRGGRLAASVYQFAGRADLPFSFELGDRLVVLLVAPIDVAVLMDGGGRPKKLVEALEKQCIFAALLFGERTMWRAWRRHPLRARLAPAPVLGN